MQRLNLGVMTNELRPDLTRSHTFRLALGILSVLVKVLARSEALIFKLKWSQVGLVSGLGYTRIALGLSVVPSVIWVRLGVARHL